MNYKWISLIVPFLFLGEIVQAQQFTRIFLFDDFKEARILFRNHSKATMQVNYDASNKVMLFRQGTELMEMGNTALVDTLFVDGRMFVPAAKGFYEVVRLEHGEVRIDWLLKEVNLGSKGALGSVTQGSVHNLQMSDLGLNATEMYTPYQRQRIGSMEVYRRKADNTYLIQVKGKWEKVKKPRQLEKLFPGQEERIRAYVKEHKVDMKNASDALVLLDYCLGL